MSGKSFRYGGGESSDRIVPTKCANKGGGPSAERAEGRRSAKEIPEWRTDAGHSARERRQLRLFGSACGPTRPGVLISKVGTVCVRSASTGLCGGQRVTAVPTVTATRLG